MVFGTAMTMLRNGRLPDGRSVDIHIGSDGCVSKISDSNVSDSRASNSNQSGDHDLCGWLLLPAMAEPHAHLDKALTVESAPNLTGDLLGAVDAWGAASKANRFTHEDTVRRASAAVELLLVHGVTAVRTHVNVGGRSGADKVIALNEVKAKYEGLIDIQTVALTPAPMTGQGSASNRAGQIAAVEAGVDFVGGCPQFEPDVPKMIANTLELASIAGIGIDLHVDETLDASVLTLRELARQVQDSGFDGLVAASHCVSLGMQTPELQRIVAAEVADAGIAIFALPQTNLFLQGRDNPSAMPRGLTALGALAEAGVLVAAGADNVQDPFNPIGRSDPLETAALLVLAGHQKPETAYDMVSNNVREAIGLAPVIFDVGCPADLVAIDALSTRGAIANAPMSRKVFRKGKLVASATQKTAVHR